MKEVLLPAGCELARLARSHSRSAFRSGEAQVDDWLRTKALQHQEKRLSATKVLLDSAGMILGYYTIAPGQVEYGDLPADFVKKLPRRPLPIAVVAWLGVSERERGQGLGTRLLALALRDCFEAGRTFPFVAVVLDCLNDAAKHFFLKFDFHEIPGNPYRLFLSAARLEAMMNAP